MTDSDTCNTRNQKGQVLTKSGYTGTQPPSYIFHVELYLIIIIIIIIVKIIKIIIIIKRKEFE